MAEPYWWAKQLRWSMPNALSEVLKFSMKPLTPLMPLTVKGVL